MTIDEAEKITTEFGEFYAYKAGSLPVLEDGTLGDDYKYSPYYSVWDLKYSPAKIKYAFLYRAEHAVKHGYMDYAPPGKERDELSMSELPIGNILLITYGLLADFVENAYEINKIRREILLIEDQSKQKAEIIKFEAKYKVGYSPNHLALEVEFKNFLADLHGNWSKDSTPKPI